ncbi:hypothetical protein HN358_03200 [Candidatus Uhrbacteria bacterium]|nr:hypothetical protein [Candidatus Uhrbacteria bacterium]MBT7717638.1 hypothetical protein [Candidatus Uhrbacteria bacterium]
MSGDPTTTVEKDEGLWVVTHCFFDVTAHGDLVWQDIAEELHSLGCTVDEVRSAHHGLPRLNFRVTMPGSAVRGTAVRKVGECTADVFILGDVSLHILRPHRSRSCRTLLIGRVVDLEVGSFWHSLSSELAEALAV